MPVLTIVYAYRNRDSLRIRRLMDSLAAQTFKDFRVVFIDYGSQPAYANAAKAILDEYSFADYIYTETRGWVFNKSHALNTGIRMVDTPYTMLSDVDMIYTAGFIGNVVASTAEDAFVYAITHWLPEWFSNWQNISEYAGKLPTTGDLPLGACVVAATEHFLMVRGLHENHQGWGGEDVEFNERLQRICQLRVVRAEDTSAESAMFHQWHPSNAKDAYRTLPPREVYMPLSAWEHVLWNRFHGNVIEPEKVNQHDWGRMITEDERPILRMVRDGLPENVVTYRKVPTNPYMLVGLMKQLTQAESGQVIKVEGTAFPQRHEWLTRQLRFVNRVLRKFLNTQLDYAVNAYDDYIKLLVMIDSTLPEDRRLLKDYYLHPDGYTLLMRA